MLSAVVIFIVIMLICNMENWKQNNKRMINQSLKNGMCNSSNIVPLEVEHLCVVSLASSGFKLPDCSTYRANRIIKKR